MNPKETLPRFDPGPFERLLATPAYMLGAVKFGSFRLKLHESFPDAPMSPFYVDLRILRRLPLIKRAAVTVYESLLKPLTFDLLSDVPTGATPFVSSLSDRLEVGMISPRLDPKSYGAKAPVDGLLKQDAGKTAVLIDDVITTADSKLKALKILARSSITVRDVVVLIDREQGGKESLEKAGFALHSAITVSRLLAFYQDQGIITPETRSHTLEKLHQLNRFMSQIV